MVSSLTTLPPDAYVPILKGKSAELGAVATAPRSRLVPLIEFIDLSKGPSALTKAWPSVNDVVWVQLLNLEGLEESQFDQQISDFFDTIRGKVAAVPVLTTTEEPSTLLTIAKIISQDKRGAVLRIDVEDLIESELDTPADISSTMDQLNIPRTEVTLVIDGGTLTGTPTIQASVATQALKSINVDDWLSVVLSFSAFPPELGKVAATDTVTAISRDDAKSFATVQNSTGLNLVYADYAVGTPLYGGAPFAPIPNIRYAANSHWKIHRGKQRKNPSQQYRDLANDIINATYYDGPQFSPGDKQISEVASQVSGPGNATTHLRAATSRHLHLVLSRLASLGVP